MNRCIPDRKYIAIYQNICFIPIRKSFTRRYQDWKYGVLQESLVINLKGWLDLQSFSEYYEINIMMFRLVFLSPQVKQCGINTYKHGIYKLPQELPNDLRLRILGNQEISSKCLKFIEWKPSAQSYCKNEHFVNTSQKPLKNRN